MLEKQKRLNNKDKNKRDLHTETIVTHIGIVKDLCYQMGIPELGDSHDLSKFSPEEFEIYKYADGKRSPHDNARDKLGYSPSWVHHKARNPHHWEYWTDFNSATNLTELSTPYIYRNAQENQYHRPPAKLDGQRTGTNLPQLRI